MDKDKKILAHPFWKLVSLVSIPFFNDVVDANLFHELIYKTHIHTSQQRGIRDVAKQLLVECYRAHLDCPKIFLRSGPLVAEMNSPNVPCKVPYRILLCSIPGQREGGGFEKLRVRKLLWSVYIVLENSESVIIIWTI